MSGNFFKFLKSLLSVGAFFLTQPQAHARIAIVVGGGDEATLSPTGEVISAGPNMFREPFGEIGRAFENPGSSAHDWDARYLYGGNETVCDASASGDRACPLPRVSLVQMLSGDFAL